VPIDVGIAILAGGRATRLPGKLTATTGDVPMIVRVLRNVRDASREIVVATSAELADEISALVDVPVVVDAEPARGPVAGLLAAFAAMESSRIFALAGDAPFVDAAFVDRLAVRWEPGDEAVVPVHDDGAGAMRSEPLAALYDRTAFLRTGTEIVRAGRGAMRLVVEALATRFVRVEEETFVFANVNTPADDAAFRAELRTRGEIA